MNLKPDLLKAFLALGLEEKDVATLIDCLRKMQAAAEEDAKQTLNQLEHNDVVKTGLMEKHATLRARADSTYRLITKLSDSDAAEFREQTPEEAVASPPTPVVETPKVSPEVPTPVAAPEPQKVASLELRNPFMDIGVA